MSEGQIPVRIMYNKVQKQPKKTTRLGHRAAPRPCLQPQRLKDTLIGGYQLKHTHLVSGDWSTPRDGLMGSGESATRVTVLG
jgi:hypothetical protein